MVHAPNKKSKSAKLPDLTAGVRAAARALGCNHGHLSRVLRGERASKSLMRRYRQLKKAAR